MTLQETAERPIKNFPNAEELERHIAELPGYWAPETERVLGWTRTWLTAWNEGRGGTLRTAEHRSGAQGSTRGERR
jgi:hypothetical protein